jgi:transposase
MAKLGEDVTEILDYIPGRFQVLRHVRPKYACKRCDRIAQAPAPALPIPRGRPSAALLAHVLVAKYCDHLPLYRQAEIYARDGVDLDRSTMADWVGQAAWLLDPIVEGIRAHEARGKPADQRIALRAASKPLLDGFFEWADDVTRKLSAKSALAEAFRYTIKRRQALTRFLDLGYLEADNNRAENCLRGVALGRKNWNFAGSDTGGERTAAIYTIIETAKLNNIDPEAYLRDRLAKIAEGHPINRIKELMPWRVT